MYELNLGEPFPYSKYNQIMIWAVDLDTILYTLFPTLRKPGIAPSINIAE